MEELIHMTIFLNKNKQEAHEGLYRSTGYTIILHFVKEARIAL